MVTLDTSIVFTAALPPGEKGTSALLLAESIRAYAGRLSGSPILLYVTPNTVLPHVVGERLKALDVEFVNYEVDKEDAKFFFLPEVTAAAQAEERVEGENETMVWLGANTLVLQEPRDFLLPAGKSVGYRPVHITNVGSRIDAPVDDFWSLIYERCRVPQNRVFPMKTHVDGNIIRPYFNAGHLAVSPGKRLLRKWSKAFLKLYRAPEFQRFYADGRYRVFMHQAVLSGVILAEFTRGELHELPSTYNYPTHLHGEDATCGKPTSIEEMVTVRHEGFWEEPDWEKRMPARETLKKWMRDRLPKN
jgi:hypothetical protein